MISAGSRPDGLHAHGEVIAAIGAIRPTSWRVSEIRRLYKGENRNLALGVSMHKYAPLARTVGLAHARITVGEWRRNCSLAWHVHRSFDVQSPDPRDSRVRDHRAPDAWKHQAQVMTYLHLTGCPAGLLINFNVPRLTDGVKRLINARGSRDHGVNRFTQSS